MIQLSVWQDKVVWFLNEYYCVDCDLAWDDEWSCGCDDRCPSCDVVWETLRSTAITPDTESKLELAIQHANEAMLSGYP